MDTAFKPEALENCTGVDIAGPSSPDTYVQLVISLTLGLSAFVTFCILRPRWKALYSARKRHSDPQVNLPNLPDSFLGWIPALFKVTEEQVLASAGLDAFVFLSFFKMSIRLFSTMFFFALVVLLPIHRAYGNDDSDKPPKTYSSQDIAAFGYESYNNDPTDPFSIWEDGNEDKSWGWSYLWAYVVFTWFFSGLTVYIMNTETIKVLKIRQDYLGTQRTVTDRTFRLVGIPEDLRSETKVKEFVENLEIGNVRSVTVCRDWSEIDNMMARRQNTLRKLEEAWTVYRFQQESSPHFQADHAPAAAAAPENGAVEPSPNEEAPEGDRLLTGTSLDPDVKRPTVRVRYGFLKLKSRVTDALDYYEEKLRRLDENILVARKKDYRPTGTAFVTMDSTAACQMAIQALMDPRPGQLLSKPAPAPSDVVWRNTYASRFKRRIQSWSVTVFITVLSLVWLLLVASLAQLISICSIRLVAPDLAKSLEQQDITRALVRTGLPTLLISLLNILVPYLYDYLSNQQGMISQGDVELSVVSKNFFFVFFNIFVVYAISGTAAVTHFWTSLRDSLSDGQAFAQALARGIRSLNNFYFNFIMLQGLGLFPFRLLQFGSVALYPILRLGAKTPRDFAELNQPTIFQHGFFLPTALLTFILCLVYSILPDSYLVLGLGTCYFGLGYMVFKYQLLYSMDQPQHATGGAWPMICERLILGLVVFQVTMIGILLLNSAIFAGTLIAPLLLFTFWYLHFFRERFRPLSQFIALRSIKRNSDPGVQSHPDNDEEPGSDELRLTRRMSTVDEDREKGMRFVNPNLISRLDQPWIYRDPPPALTPEESVSASRAPSIYSPDNGGAQRRSPIVNGQGSTSSSFSLGDTHVWREAGGEQV